MQIDWTTFALEIVNFLVLVWILTRFFYRPILDVIARRRAGIERTLGEARATEAQAAGLKRQYEERLAAWDREQAEARAHLGEEIARERERLLAGVAAAVAAAREKNQVLDERRRQEWRRAAEEQALAQSAAFAARVLSRFADADLSERVVDAMVADLPQLALEQKQALAAAADEAPLSVVTAHPLGESVRVRLANALRDVLGRAPETNYAVDESLVAGVLISVGPWLLHANLRDELRFFAGGPLHAA